MNILSPLNKLEHPVFNQYKLDVWLKRDDKIHPIISGNKWRKLKHNLLYAKDKNYKGILSFGGSYSNHIHALAFACHQAKLNCIGVIRGEPEYASNFTLSCAKNWQMQLKFVDRITYRRRNDESYLAELQKEFPKYLIVPEGGSNELALVGVGEVINELNQQKIYDTLICPVGSAGTISGLIKQDKNQHKIIGIPVLKDKSLTRRIESLIAGSPEPYTNWKLLTEYHCGGYAKFNQDNVDEIIQFNQTTKTIFEPIYSGKMILALLALIKENYFPEGHRIVLLHTGGLQGIGGLIERGLLSKDNWKIPNF